MTGLSDPELAAASILERPGALTQWCVVKMGPQGALIRTRHPAETLRQSAIQACHPTPALVRHSSLAHIAYILLARASNEANMSPVLALNNSVLRSCGGGGLAGQTLTTFKTCKHARNANMT